MEAIILFLLFNTYENPMVCIIILYSGLTEVFINITLAYMYDFMQLLPLFGEHHPCESSKVLFMHTMGNTSILYIAVMDTRN